MSTTLSSSDEKESTKPRELSDSSEGGWLEGAEDCPGRDDEEASRREEELGSATVAELGTHESLQPCEANLFDLYNYLRQC